MIWNPDGSYAVWTQLHNGSHTASENGQVRNSFLLNVLAYFITHFWQDDSFWTENSWLDKTIISQLIFYCFGFYSNFRLNSCWHRFPREQQVSLSREKYPTPGMLPHCPCYSNRFDVMISHALGSASSPRQQANQRYADVSSTHWTLSPFQSRVIELPGKTTDVDFFHLAVPNRVHQPPQIGWTRSQNGTPTATHSTHPSEDFVQEIQPCKKCKTVIAVVGLISPRFPCYVIYLIWLVIVCEIGEESPINIHVLPFVFRSMRF